MHETAHLFIVDCLYNKDGHLYVDKGGLLFSLSRTTTRYCLFFLNRLPVNPGVFTVNR